MTEDLRPGETTLAAADRLTDTPISAARRRRYWMIWWLWAIFGAAVTFRGMPEGSWLIAAAVLTAPFWALFLLWPVFWLRDRRRARGLWAEDVALILGPAAEGAGEETAIPVIFGRGSALIPCFAWEAAFPTVDPAALGIEVLPSDARPGVHLAALPAEALLGFDGWADAASAHDASAEDWEAARLWTEALRRALVR